MILYDALDSKGIIAGL